MSTRVQLDLSSVESTPSGSIVGRVWIEIDGFAFPEAGWYDFPVAILTWWIEALRGLVSHSSDEATLRFMDGPFETRVESGDQGVMATFLRSGSPVRSTAEVEPDELLTSALESAEALVSTLENQGVRSSDLDELIRATRRPE